MELSLSFGNTFIFSKTTRQQHNFYSNNNTFAMAEVKKDKKDKKAEGFHPADVIFDQFDKDKSGALDKKEVEAALGQLAKAQGISFFFLSSDFLCPSLLKSFSLCFFFVRLLLFLFSNSSLLGKKKPNSMMVKAAIKIADSDNSGEIDRKEFRDMADKLLGLAKDGDKKKSKTKVK